MEKKIKIKINGIEVESSPGKTILETARENNIYIPSLCYLKDINKLGACRICLVEIKGIRGLQPSCTYPVEEGMEVYTNSNKVRKTRKAVLELILSNHPQDCLKCSRNQNCELQSLAAELGISDFHYQGATSYEKYKESERGLTWAIQRNPDKCILCRRCIAACTEIQGVGILSAVKRGL